MSPRPRDHRDEAEEAVSPAQVDGVLLCAGVGQRRRPLTESIPKALIPVAGRPLLEYHLEAWRSAGVRHVVLVVGYREEQVRQYVKERSDFGLEVEYVTQPEQRSLRTDGRRSSGLRSRTRPPTVD
jgi:NDP-sugar pyrophosphorylase family protein